MLPVTLTTDFGSRDPYVAVMKGVILERAPGVALHDLSHDIGPQSISEGALFLATALPWFGPAVHCAVVDPGVGTGRRPVAIAYAGSALVGPDNGLFARFLLAEGLARSSAGSLELVDCKAVALDESKFWRIPVAPTFHGRSIFAPVAAELATGTDLSVLGSAISALAGLPWPEPIVSGDRVQGEIVHVDHFGNLITNVEPQAGAAVSAVTIRGRRIDAVVDTYGAGRGLIALTSSSGLIEIAEVNGSAAALLEVVVGEPVTVQTTLAASTSG